MRTSNKHFKYLTKKQLDKLFKSIESSRDFNKYYLRDLALFNIAYYCWLRISEISLIKLDQYNKDSWEIYIKRLKWSNNSTITLDNKRRLLLNRYIREYSLKDDNALLFSSKSWSILNKSNIEFLVKKYKDLSWLDNFHFHMLKHSIAVHLLEIWVDIFALKNYLGHKSIDSTMVYASFSSLMNKEIFNKINTNGLV